MIKVISFDMDDTLISGDFDNYMWNEEIPRLYAKNNNISLEKAKEKVYSEYYRKKYVHKEQIKDWTSVEGWFNRLGLGSPSKELIISIVDESFLFPQIRETLEILKKDFRLILSTDNTKWLTIHKLKANNLLKYFDAIYSISDTQTTKETTKYYEYILKQEKIQPNEIIHIGDNTIRDGEIPEHFGMHTIIIDRAGIVNKSNTVKNFAEIPVFIKKKFA